MDSMRKRYLHSKIRRVLIKKNLGTKIRGVLVTSIHVTLLDNPTKVGMVGFGYFCREKELEEYPNKVYNFSLRDFASSQHKVGLIGIMPYYTHSILS